MYPNPYLKNKEVELFCDHCGAKMVRKEKERDDGSKAVFYACPNWKKDGSGCEGGIKYPPKEPAKAVYHAKETPKPEDPGINMISRDKITEGMGMIRGDIKKLRDELNEVKEMLKTMLEK